MHILVVGLNHRTSPVEIRENFSLPDDELSEALKTLRQKKSILEATILSTCNRMEVYVVSDQSHTGRYYTKAFMADWFGVGKDTISPHLDIREDEHAIEHLFRVTCGLDSMILGETQILGQVRDSFFMAQDTGVTGIMLNHVFKQALTLAKQAHATTDIGEHAVSVSYAAVELTKQIFGNPANKNVLILGAGEMGELTAKHLYSGGAAKVTVANRTKEHALELAGSFGGQAVAMEDIETVLSDTDILISSTGAADYVMTKKNVASAIKRRKGRPLFMVDIAVPRDIDPQLHDFDGVFLYDIDDLNGIVESNLADRRKEAEKVELLLEKELKAYRDWLDTLDVVPVISALRSKALGIQGEVMQSIERKLPELNEHEKKVLRKHTKSIVNQLLREPVQNIKELAAEPHKDDKLQSFTSLFALEDEVKEEKKNREEKERAAMEKDTDTRQRSVSADWDRPLGTEIT